MVLDNSDHLGSYKCRQAHKLDIPIVSTDFLQACVDEGKLVHTKHYLLEKSINSQKFDKGKIACMFNIWFIVRDLYIIYCTHHSPQQLTSHYLDDARQLVSQVRLTSLLASSR